MLSSTSSRLAGLPVSPRPQKQTTPIDGPVHVQPRLPPTSPVRSRPDLLSPGTSSLHTRSRSQPPRVISSPNHGRSASTTTRRYEEDDRYDNGQASSKSNLPVKSRNTSRPEIQSHGRSVEASSAPSAEHSDPEIPYIRPTAQKAPIDELSGDGYTIWNTVSSVTSALTVSVSKAWSANIPTFSGEDTPPGQESRLTRAMKAYHITKAQSPSDLPDWLFDERDRRIVGTQAQPNDDVGDPAYQVQALPKSQTNLRLKSASDGEGHTSDPALPETTPSQCRLRGTDRLKTMREARKLNGEGDASEGFIGDTRQNSTNAPRLTIQRSRIGLPSGPPRGRR